ncbi:MAG: hypothetical protein ABF747_04255 [Bifidobacterium sp.]|uniref:Uncharacterized protein n=1 Tax=Bifidobacterium fermentum TaxID=3059035 RepID=A0AB39UGM5_9BIFI
MAWNVYYNGDVFGPITEAKYKTLRKEMSQAVRDVACVEFGSTNGDIVKTAIWTIGAPISFEHISNE